MQLATKPAHETPLPRISLLPVRIHISEQQDRETTASIQKLSSALWARLADDHDLRHLQVEADATTIISLVQN